MAQNLLTRSNPTTRPKGKDGKDGKFREPLDVFVAMKVDQITDVDTITGRVYVKLDVIFMWDDDRFPVERPIPKDTWGPYMRLHNEVNIDVKEKLFSVQSPGRLKRVLTYKGTVMNVQDLKSFPFDSDEIDVHFRSHFDWMPFDVPEKPHIVATLGSAEQPHYRLALAHKEEHGHEWPDDPLELRWPGNIHEWELKAVTLSLEEDPYNRTYTPVDLRLRIDISRASSYYLAKALFPLYLISLLSFCAFGFEAEMTEQRLTVIITCFLASIGLLFVISSSLPKTSYLTAIDNVILITVSMLVIAALLLTFAGVWLDKLGLTGWTAGLLAVVQIAANWYVLDGPLRAASKEKKVDRVGEFVKKRGKRKEEEATQAARARRKERNELACVAGDALYVHWETCEELSGRKWKETIKNNQKRTNKEVEALLAPSERQHREYGKRDDGRVLPLV